MVYWQTVNGIYWRLGRRTLWQINNYIYNASNFWHLCHTFWPNPMDWPSTPFNRRLGRLFDTRFPRRIFSRVRLNIACRPWCLSSPEKKSLSGEGGGGGGLWHHFSPSRFFCQYSRHRVGISLYITNLSDKQASKEVSFFDPKWGVEPPNTPPPPCLRAWPCHISSLFGRHVFRYLALYWLLAAGMLHLGPLGKRPSLVTFCQYSIL